MNLLDPTATERQTLELEAVLDETQGFSGVAKVEIRVLNGWKLDHVNTFGRSENEFACLRDCLTERLKMAGYSMKGFDFGDYFN